MSRHDPAPAPPPSPLPRFSGRVALVTGAGRGIGLAIAQGLAREGCAPEDVANTVLFLLSEEARFVSGSTISVDAADSAHWN